MIHPSARSTLTEALQPPSGYRFDAGVATTYSLSLGALLGLPAHFALLGDHDNSAEEDPLRLVEGLRRASRRLAVFCERGRMEAPPAGNALAVLAEGMVHEVCAPHGGAFHPKIWALRYVAIDAAAEPATVVRLLVLTRNLTWDRCWDVSLRLDGVPGKAKEASNKPLADFLRWLPLNTEGASPDLERQAMIVSLAKDIERADWEKPPGFTQLAFHVLGTAKRAVPWSPLEGGGKAQDVLIVSPFVRAGALQTLREHCNGDFMLVSRADELDRLPAGACLADDSAYVLKPDTLLSEGEEAGQADTLQGLHAKVAVFQRGQRVHVAVGSANYTNAVVQNGSNVEVVAELSGPVSRIPAPRQWLDEHLQPLLDTYTPGGGEDAEGAERRQLQDQLEAIRRQIAAAAWTLHCETHPVSGWNLALSCPGLPLDGATLHAWPLAVVSERARAVQAGQVDLGTFAGHEVSSLVGFQVTPNSTRAEELAVPPLRFALEVSLEGAPDDRADALVAQLLGSRAAFLRYLALLLDDPQAAGCGARNRADGSSGGSRDASGLMANYPLFEQLLRIYSREPERLEAIDRMVKRLKDTQFDGQPCLPDDFLALWEVVGNAIGKEAA